jgi:thiosulfate/3-mercaptopyruvate sulfurtransferase
LLTTTLAFGKSFDETSLLVGAQWLEENLDLEDLVIIDFGRSRTDYDKGHIPGAVFLERAAVYGTVDGVDGMLPPPEKAVPLLEAAGISNDSKVVIYDAIGGLWASRLFWGLEFFGHKDVHILNGGYPAWEADGRPVSTETPSVKAGVFKHELQWDTVANTEYILSNIANEDVQVIDTRSVGEYEGTDVRADRGGHIPNAINLDWALNLDENRVFLSLQELVELYDTADVSKDKTQVTHCQTGVRGAHTYFVLRYLGYEDVRLYDESWVVWGNRPDTPIEK